MCGILIEQGRGTVVGIGLNVRHRQNISPPGLPNGDSLAQFTDAELDARFAAEALLRRMDEEYGRLLDGDLATLEERWKRHIGLIGRDVMAERTTGRRTAAGCWKWDSTAYRWRDRKMPLVLPPETVRHLDPAADET